MNFIINPKANIEDEFDRLAYLLFNKIILLTNNDKYYLTEIEFYYHSKTHPDPFVHGHTQQQTNGEWYFHGSGMDITIGGGTPDIYGGILIRGVKTTDKKGKDHYTDGPLNVMQEIMNNLGSVTNKKHTFRLEQIDLSRKNKIRKHGRIGLNAKGKPQGATYVGKHYRYLIDLNVAHKYKAKENVQKHGKDVSCSPSNSK